jgi:hypothetical protein
MSLLKNVTDKIASAGRRFRSLAAQISSNDRGFSASNEKSFN